jgi:hypothetical protein
MGCTGRSGLTFRDERSDAHAQVTAVRDVLAATKMVVQGARERMSCHVAPIRTPCSVDPMSKMSTSSAAHIYVRTGMLTHAFSTRPGDHRAASSVIVVGNQIDAE